MATIIGLTDLDLIIVQRKDFLKILMKFDRQMVFQKEKLVKEIPLLD
jgi:hypothetical protein